MWTLLRATPGGRRPGLCRPQEPQPSDATGASFSLPVAFAGYAVGGLGHGVKNTLLRLTIQQRVPGRLHGRAFAAYSAARNAAELVALAAGGLLVAPIGPRPALLIAGLAPVVLAAVGLVVLRPAFEPGTIRGAEAANVGGGIS